ncbi:MAG: L-threonylcarbamoyladenylate synthase [Desulfomonilaceae bacterium]
MYEAESLYHRAWEIVRSGGLVILPTETFYALAASPFREDAVQRVFRIKRRHERTPLPLIASDMAAVKKLVCRMSTLERKLTDRFWPGSLTILMTPSKQVTPLLMGPEGKIGVRIPPECPARIVAAHAGGWLTATSANLSGDPSPEDVASMAGEVLDAVDLVMDLGPTPGGKPSTVLEPLDGGCRVLREGAVPESVIRDYCMRNNVTVRLAENGRQS